jgi:hypothetical protein
LKKKRDGRGTKAMSDYFLATLHKKESEKRNQMRVYDDSKLDTTVTIKKQHRNGRERLTSQKPDIASLSKHDIFVGHSEVNVERK